MAKIETCRGYWLNPQLHLQDMQRRGTKAWECFNRGFKWLAMRRIARHVGIDNAEDSYQEILILFYNEIHKIDLDGKPNSLLKWFLKFCQRRAIDIYRKHKKWIWIYDVDDQRSTEDDSGNDPEIFDGALGPDGMDPLIKFKNEMPFQQRRAFELHFQSGLDYEQIGEMMGISGKTAQNYCLLAIKNIRKTRKQYPHFDLFE